MINGIDSPYKGCGGLTREQFLFHETRVVARLMTDENLSDQEIIDRVVLENLFQFPTERMIRNLAEVCVKRLHCLDDNYKYASLYRVERMVNCDIKTSDVTLRGISVEEAIKSLISYAVGCMFGRYSLDVPGLAYAG